MNRLSDLKRMILLLLAGILSACSHDDLIETRPAENGEPLVLTAVMADATTGTRATPDNSWEGTETVIVEVIDNYDNYDDTTNPDWTQAKRGIYTAGTDGKLTFVSGTQSTWLSDDETKLVRAWHYGDNSTTFSSSWSVQTNQTDDNYAKSDLLFAQATVVSGRKEIALKFYHQVAKVVVHVRNVGPVYGSDDVSVTIGYMNNIVMDGTVSTDKISENYLDWTLGNARGYITAYSLGPKPLASDENETSLASFAALVIPQTYNESLLPYLDIKNGLRSYPCYSSTEITWEAGHSYTYEVTIMEENRVTVDNITVSGWDNGGNYDLTTTE